MDGPRLERQCAERHVERHAVGVPQQHDPSAEGETPGIVDPTRQALKQPRHVCAFGAESGEQGEIDVPREPRLPPPLHGQAADEAEVPSLTLAEVLHFLRGEEEGVHRRVPDPHARRPSP
jgi:hypothetical protein